MGKRIRIMGIERRTALPAPEEVAEGAKNLTTWLRSKKVVIYHASEHEEAAKRLADHLREVSKRLGVPVEEIHIREAKDYPDGSAAELHAWLGKKRMDNRENALYVAIGPFTGADRHGEVEYNVLASAGVGGFLAVHPDLLKSELAKELLIHELLHLFGLKHEHDLPIMNPLRPTWDETSKEYAQRLVQELLQHHGVDVKQLPEPRIIRREKKRPWWKFW